MRNTIDFSPLYHSAIGFDRMANLLDSVARDAKPSYPPYNIEQVDENEYRITMAVASRTTAKIATTCIAALLRATSSASSSSQSM